MKNLLILQPTPIAAISASRGTGAANLLTPHPREVWIDSAVGSAASIDIDLGAVRVVNTICLAHVRPPHVNATWTITGGTADYTSIAIATGATLRVPDVNGRSPALSHAFWYGDAVSARYLRLALTQPAGSSPLSAGVVMVGRALVPGWNHEWGSGRRPLDTGSSTALPDGGFAVVEGVRKSAWYWTLGDLTDDELDALYEVALDRGETRPLLVVEDPDRTAGLRRRLHYGLFRQLREFERAQRNRTRWELQIEEWGADEAAPISSLPIDTVPDAFAFAPVVGADRSVWVESQAIMVGGLEGAAAISVAGGQYQIDGGAWTASAGTVSNGQSVRVRLTSAAGYSAEVQATLTIGGVAAMFSARTMADTGTPVPDDSVPDSFAFTAQTGAARSTLVTSDAITVSGINVPAAITVTGGEYQIGSGAWTSSAGTVSNGQTVRVRVTSSADYSTAASVTVTIGGVAGTFAVTTEAAPSAVASIDEGGWSAQWVGTPPSSPQAFALSRQGYDAGGNPVTVPATLYGTFWVDQPYPNQSTKTAATVALDDWVYSTDTVIGRPNNSTLVSPKPNCNWLMEDRTIVGDYIDWEIVAWHRNGVACVEVTGSDGTTTAPVQRVSAMQAVTWVNGVEGPVYACIYKGRLDVSGLADVSRVTLSASVKPKVGGSASVASTADSADPQLFSPRYYRRSVAQFASPRRVYVSTVSGTTGGIVSTDDAAAYAAACDSWQTARQKAVAAYGTIDGVEFVLKGDSAGWGTFGSTTAALDTAGIVMRKDHRVSGRQAWAFGAGVQPRLANPAGIPGGGSIAIRGFAITRTASGFNGSNATAGTTSQFQFSDCLIDGGNVVSAFFNSATVAFRGGCDFQNIGTVALASSTTASFTYVGCTGDLGTSTEGRLVVGCAFGNPGQFTFHSSKSRNNCIFLYNEVSNGTSSIMGIFGANPDASPLRSIVVGQSLIVSLSNVSQPLIRASSDSETYSTVDVSLVNLSTPGYDELNRYNCFYDENSTVARSHSLLLLSNNVVQARLASKGDVFTQITARTGNHPYTYGCGKRSNLVCWLTEFPHRYNGRGSVVAATTGASGYIDPKFVDDRGPTAAASGTAGGNYRLQSTSPAIGMAIDEWFPFDLDGVARTRGTVGAYA
jgi:hypothetical protein